jgi:hypothetical protein
MANNPTLLTMPLCKDADKSTIPATDAGTAGIFSEQYGWQSINSLPLQAGGKAVRREDFNGAFNLLGGIAFYAQKGFTFNFDATQDYFAGCMVIDATDGKRYECIADVAAGGSVPSADTTHWKTFGEVDVSGKANITLDNLAAYHRDVITTSGTYTAPATALYKVTIKGGGGGGGRGYTPANNYGGGGGGEGGTTIAYVTMTANDTATVVIGGGGAGATSNSQAGADGGDTTVTYNRNTYTASGGGGGGGGQYSAGGMGGNGTIVGCCGGGADISPSGSTAGGGNGGGAGGGIGGPYTAGGNGTTGAGGGGGACGYNGGNGGDGFVWFEYFA